MAVTEDSVVRRLASGLWGAVSGSVCGQQLALLVGLYLGRVSGLAEPVGVVVGPLAQAVRGAAGDLLDGRGRPFRPVDEPGPGGEGAVGERLVTEGGD